MTLWAAVPLIPGLANLLLTAIVLRSNWRSQLHRVVALFLLALAVWAFAVFGLRISADLGQALHWQKVALAVGPLGAVFYFHFTVLMTRPAADRRFRNTVIASYVLVLVFLRHRPSGLTVKCRRERSRALNRYLARRRLVERLEEIRLGRLSAERQRREKIRRQKRRRSRRAKAKMLEEKRKQSEKKRERTPIRSHRVEE